MMAIIAPPIFSLWRKRAVHGPKDTPGGGFRFPPPGPPLETTQRKGPRPLPLETIPESRGSGSGKRSRGYRQAPTTIDTVRRGPSGIKYGNLRPRPTQKAGIFNRSLFLSQKSVFLFHRARRIFFLQKENGGRICQPSSWLQSTPHSENSKHYSLCASRHRRPEYRRCWRSLAAMARTAASSPTRMSSSRARVRAVYSTPRTIRD